MEVGAHHVNRFLLNTARRAAGSDNVQYVNFRGVDFAVVILAGEPGGSMHAAVRIRLAVVSEVCGGLGAVGPGVHVAA